MSPRNTAVIIVQVLIAGLLSAIPSTASAVQDGTSPDPFVDTAHVDIVNVDVLVTDRGGVPVRGLRQGDFELVVDGTPVPITNFFAAGAEATPPDDAVGGATSTTPGAPTMPAEQRRSLVIYVDNRGGHPLARDQALRELAAELPSYLAGGRQVMLVSQDREISVLHGFGDDPDDLPARLAELAGTTAGGSSLAREHDEILAAIDRTKFTIDDNVPRDVTDPSQLDPSIRALQNQARSLLQQSRSYADNLLQDLRGRLAMMTQFEASLAGIPGKKEMLYIGEGFDTRPGEDLFRIWEQRYPELGEEMFFSSDQESSHYRIDDELDQLVAQANASAVTCHTLYTAGPERFSSLSARSSGPAGAATVATSSRRAIQDSLSYLASATGGLALSPGGEVGAAIARLPDEIDAYYSLGFEPLERDDQVTHSIEVSVAGEGLKVFHREFFRFRSVDERMTDLTYAALLFEPGPNPLEAEVALTGIEQRDQGRYEVSVAMTLPLDNLALVPAKGNHIGEVEVYFAVKDRRGWASPVRVQSFPVTIPNSDLFTALGQTATFSWKLLSRPGPHELAVTVRDAIAEVASTAAAEFDVATAKE